MSEPWDLRTVPWRTGQHVGRTIYACPPGSSYRYGEGLIGMMDTPELAAHLVEVHNAWIADCQDFGCQEHHSSRYERGAE